MNRNTLATGLFVGCFAACGTLLAQPNPSEALSIKPMQKGVDFDLPEQEEISNCLVEPEDRGGGPALVVRSAAGVILRQFIDSNSDKKVDQWRYYKNGVEIYRDIDQDFNGKADQYRWLGTAGTRWGLDPDEDGKIDRWKAISAEEVTAEVVEAIRTRDKSRFVNVLLDDDELAALGLGKRLSETIGKRIRAARGGQFDRTVAKQKLITGNTQWIDFGGLRPGTIPSGTDGSTQDVTVYENVVAMVETKNKPSQVPMGTLIKVGLGWRVVDLSVAAEDGDTPQFVFFEGTSQPDLTGDAGLGEETQKLIELLQAIDDQLGKTRNPRELVKLNGRRADALEQLASAAATQTDRDMWWMQFADTVGTAAQSGTDPKATQRLAELRRKLEGTTKNKELLAHVTFSHMSAKYAEELHGGEEDFGKVQDKWLGKLESFVKKYPRTSDAPEAMLQLALAKEFAGEEKDANRWYTRIVSDYEKSPLAAKAGGAKRRLESVGKTMALRGRTVQGKPFDLKRLRGNVVLVHYWATWCEPCQKDMKTIAQLKEEFARAKFDVVGVNVDAQSDDLTSYLKSNRPGWTHLHEPGGLDGRLASEMGVFTLPVMFLIDERGRVVNRQIHAAQLKREISRLLK